MHLLACILTVFTAWYARGDTREFPVWFFHMPEESGAVYAVGYARAYAVYESAVAIAVRDAAYQLQIASGSDIRGERLFQTLPGGQIVYQGEKFEEHPINEVVPVYLDTVQVGGMILVLAASRQPNISLPARRIQPTMTPPDWITTLPDSADAMYAVGMSRMYYYEEHSWQEAERQARYEMAYSFLTRQRQFLRGTATAEYGVTATATAVQLHGLQVVSRWRSDTMCFVLVKARRGLTD